MQSIDSLFPLLEEPKKVFITTHHKPDGDAIGSMLALAHYLTKKGHTVTAVSPSELPEFLMWMPGVDQLYNYESEPKVVSKALNESDLFFGLDFNAMSRTGPMEAILTDLSIPTVLIDHHLMPADYWTYGISLPEKSSTCEMVYDFINQDGGNELIDKDIASCIYTGVMTDTGSFRFPMTTASVHLMVADLMNKGLEHTKIHEEVYDSWSYRRMQFLGYVLLEKMEILTKYNTGLICITSKDIKLFDISSGDLEGLVNYPLSIAGIRFAVLITERKNEVKLSLRSKGDFDVSSFARNHFNGGGHFNASGGRTTESFEETVNKFKDLLTNNHPK